MLLNVELQIPQEVLTKKNVLIFPHFLNFSCHTFMRLKKCNICTLLFDRQIVIRMSHFLKSVTFFSTIQMRSNCVPNL
jgi:hypothetical protein